MLDLDRDGATVIEIPQGSGFGFLDDAWAIAKSLIVALLIPLAIGLFAKWRWPDMADGLSPLMSQVSTFAVLLLLVGAIALHRDAIVSLFGTGGILAIVVLEVVALVVGYLVVAKKDDGKVKIYKKHEQPTRHAGWAGAGWGLATGPEFRYNAAVLDSTRPPLRTSIFWILVARGALIGAFGGLFAILFLGIEHAAQVGLWGDLGESFVWFSGGIRAVVFPTIAGFIVGGLYLLLRLPDRLDGFLEEVAKGHTDPRTAMGAVVVSLVSLVGGASLGPEGALVTGTSGFANRLVQRANASTEETRTATFSAAAGALGALLSSPFIGALFAFELERERGARLLFQHIIPGGVSGIVAFAIVYPVLGTPFLGLYTFPEFAFSTWFLLAGVGIGFVGAFLGIVIAMVGRLSGSIMRRLPGRPIVRAGIGGLAIGVIAFVMPATLFSGIDTLGIVIEDPARLGVGLLVAVAALKVVTLSISMTSGFYGGPFFPTFFIGGTVGVIIHLLFPALPLALAVGATMAATAAIAGIPFSIVVLAVYLVAVGPPAAGAITVAVITSIAITYGLGFVGPWSSDAASSPDTG